MHLLCKTAWMLALAIPVAVVAQRTRTAHVDHSAWSMVLGQYVGTDGLVDYHAMAADPRYQRYLLLLEQFRPADTASRQERMAYWINAYNAFSVRIIAGLLPMGRLAEHPEWEDVPLYAGSDGNPVTLRWIRKEALGRAFGDPRVPFALNPGRVDGPLLQRSAYTAQGLEDELDRAVRRYINDPARNRIGPESISLSAYLAMANDGTLDETSLRGLITQHASVPVGPAVLLNWREADDRLNRQ